MQTVKNITAEIGEECKVDVDILHETLEKLPADIYLKLYHKMQKKVIGYSYFGGCGAPITDESNGE